MTLRQLRGFWGITGYCHIWIPGYGELAWPLYKLTADGNPLQYSCLENPMDGGAWWATVHGVAKSQTRLSGFTFTFSFIAETQQAQTDKLIWSPDTQKAFKALQTALLQPPILSLPTGSEFNLFITERKGMALGVLTQS